MLKLGWYFVRNKPRLPSELVRAFLRPRATPVSNLESRPHLSGHQKTIAALSTVLNELAKLTFF